MRQKKKKEGKHRHHKFGIPAWKVDKYDKYHKIQKNKQYLN